MWNRLNHQRGDGFLDVALVICLIYAIVIALTYLFGWIFP
jgi:hypothetical protein